MFVEWDPENGEEKQTWNFDPDDVLRKDAALIEKHYGESWDQWNAGLMLGKIEARAVLLWYMLKLVHPKLRYDDVPDFRVRQLKTEMGTLELKALYKRASKMKLDQDTRDAFEAQFESDMKDAMEREGIEGQVEFVDGVLAIETADPGLSADDLPKAP